MTRARTKQLQDAISAFVMRIWDDNQLYNVGGAKNNSLKTPCTILQSDRSLLLCDVLVWVGRQLRVFGARINCSLLTGVYSPLL